MQSGLLGARFCAPMMLRSFQRFSGAASRMNDRLWRSNPAIDRDTYSAPLRALIGARDRER